MEKNLPFKKRQFIRNENFNNRNDPQSGPSHAQDPHVRYQVSDSFINTNDPLPGPSHVQDTEPDPSHSRPQASDFNNANDLQPRPSHDWYQTSDSISLSPSVSYTHLDVYKRQVLYPVRAMTQVEDRLY